MLMRWTIRSSSWAEAGAEERFTMVWISLIALKKVATGRVAPPNDGVCGVSSFDKGEA